MVAAALAHHQELLALIVENDFVGILIYDRDFRIKYWNSYVERLWGLMSADVLGRNLFELLPEIRDPICAKSLAAVLTGAQTKMTEQRFHNLVTGRTGYFDSVHKPIRDDADNITAGLMVVRDATGFAIRRKFDKYLETSGDAETCSDKVLTELGEAIEIRRKSMKMSQEKLSKLAGLHRTYISDIERGQRNVAVRNVLRIAHALQLPSWTLLHAAEATATEIPPDALIT